MSIYTNITLPFVQFSSLNLKNALSENSATYAKIAAVALVILGAAVAVFYAIKHYQAKKVNQPDPVIPTPQPIFPNPQPKPPVVKSPIIEKPPIRKPDILPQPKQPVQNRPQDPRKFPHQDPKLPKDDQTHSGGKQTQPDDKQKAPRGQTYNQMSEDEKLARMLQEAEYDDFDDKPYLKNPKPQPQDPRKPRPQDPRKPISQPAPVKLPPSKVDVPPKSDDQKPADPIVLPGNQDLPLQLPKDPPQTTPVDPVVDVPSQPVVQQKKLKVPNAPFSQQVETLLDQVSQNVFTNLSFSTRQLFNSIPSQTKGQVQTLLDELIVEYEKRFPQPQHSRIGCGDPVPQYFANVDNYGVDVKYLSLAGIRNMLIAGPGIIDDFAQQRFLGGAQHYGSRNGLNAFKYYTGTVVDLDTELDAKNDPEALAQARELIVDFGKRCRLPGNLTAEEVARQLPHRKLKLPEAFEGIHVALDNTDRSNHGIWKRQHPRTRVNTYFVNVPNCDVILSASLRFPYMVAELAWRAKEANGGKFSKDFLDDLFARGISDMCFNDKIRQFTNFHIEWMAKFDGAETPEETARNKVISGAFGEAIKLKGPDEAIKTVYRRDTLADLIGDFIDNGYVGEKNGRDLDQWLAEETDHCIEQLKAKGVWENFLYQSDKKGQSEDFPDGSDFFLLDRTTLAGFLKEYYNTYVLYM